MRQFRGLEKALQNLGDGVQGTAVRAGAFAQNLLAQAGEVRAASTLTHAFGEGRVAFVDVDDVGEAIAAVLMEGPAVHGGRAYELTGPAAVTVAECAAALSDVLGRPVAAVDQAPEERAKALVGSGVPAWFADQVLVYLFRWFRAGKGSAVATDLARLAGRQTGIREFFGRCAGAFSG